MRFCSFHSYNIVKENLRQSKIARDLSINGIFLHLVFNSISVQFVRSSTDDCCAEVFSISMVEAFLHFFQFHFNFEEALTILLIIVQKVAVSAKELNETDIIHSKSKRNALVLLYPVATSIGVAVAIAIPIADDVLNLFVSYKFEMNYNVVNNRIRILSGTTREI